MARLTKCPTCGERTIWNDENRGFFTFGEEGGFWDLFHDVIKWSLIAGIGFGLFYSILFANIFAIISKPELVKIIQNSYIDMRGGDKNE